MPKRIQLTQGKCAIVDNGDFVPASQIRWYAWFNRSTKSFYAVFSRQKNRKKTTIYLHRFLMQPPEKMVVDHKNGNTLDNRRSNLRICSQRDNVRSGRGKSGQSGFRGVVWNAQRKKWMSRIHDGSGTSTYLGLFSSKKEAAQAYNIAAKKLFGEFSHLNKI